MALIQVIQAEIKAACGSRRMHRELQARGHRISLRRIVRLMRHEPARPRESRIGTCRCRCYSASELIALFKVTVLKSTSTSAALVIAICSTAAASLAAAGQIYRCTGNDGSIEFSNLRCPPSTSVSVFSVKPNIISNSVARDEASQSPQRGDDGIASDVATYGYTAVAGFTINDEFGRARADTTRPIAAPVDRGRPGDRRIAPEPRRATR